MGHSEISAGLCSLSKVLVAMETGIIPANLHCDKIDYSLPGINNGKLKVGNVMYKNIVMNNIVIFF